MKIVHLTDTYAPTVGGIETQIRRLASLQAAAGHDVTVVSGRRGPGEPVDSNAGVLVRRPNRRTHPAAGLPLHVDDMDADLFHAHVSVLSPGTFRAAALVHAVDRPLAVTVHSMWPVTTALPGTLVRLAGLDDAAVAWSAVSTVAASRVAAVLRAGRRVDVVPNTVDTGWWHNPSPRPAGGRVHAVLVARLARRKRVLPLLRVLAADWPARLHLTIVGDGPQRPRLERLVAQAGLADHVDLVGMQSPRGVRSLLHDADLFVAPSALESFGIAALEARAAGVPVVARCGTGVSDFVADGVDGRLAGSDAELAAGIAALVAAPAALGALAAHASSVPAPIGRETSLAAVTALYERATGSRVTGGSLAVGASPLSRA